MTSLLVRTRSAGETTDLGRRIGAMLRGGDVLLLSGDLGAGKTTFIKGLAAGLGIAELPFSPTFTLVHTYEGGRLPLVHVDLYRMGTSGEVSDLGLEDLFVAPAVSAVEWGERAVHVVGDDYLELELNWDDSGEDARTITLTPLGDWRTRTEQLQELIA
jgi:tRNA threonylcarbamoyladenosine biosynthesis protein TsaE